MGWKMLGKVGLGFAQAFTGIPFGGLIREANRMRKKGASKAEIACFAIRQALGVAYPTALDELDSLVEDWDEASRGVLLGREKDLEETKALKIRQVIELTYPDALYELDEIVATWCDSDFDPPPPPRRRRRRWRRRRN